MSAAPAKRGEQRSCPSCRALLVNGMCPNEWRGGGAPPRGSHAPYRDLPPIKRGPGRPKLGDETVRVDMRWSAAELQLIDRAAALAGVSRSVWIREAALARARRAKR